MGKLDTTLNPYSFISQVGHRLRFEVGINLEQRGKRERWLWQEDFLRAMYKAAVEDDYQDLDWFIKKFGPVIVGPVGARGRHRIALPDPAELLDEKKRLGRNALKRLAKRYDCAPSTIKNRLKKAKK
jgi:hypothetical protein